MIKTITTKTQSQIIVCDICGEQGIGAFCLTGSKPDGNGRFTTHYHVHCLIKVYEGKK